MTTGPTQRTAALRELVLEQVHHDNTTRRRRWRIVAPALVVGLLAGAGATVATAAVVNRDDVQAPATDYPAPAEIDAASTREELIAALDKVAGGDGRLIPTIDEKPNGLAGLAVNRENNTVTLYWKGAVPPSVSEVINEHPDVAVEVIPATYSLVEMSDARDAIVKRLDSELAGRGALVWVGPDALGRGIDLGVQATDPTLTPSEIRTLVARISTVAVNHLDAGDGGFTAY